MQERYVGDTPDFGKYALLRALAGKPQDIRIGVNWYLTHPLEVDSPKNNDGEKRHHRSQRARFQPIDADLWGKLEDFQHQDDRCLKTFEKSQILPPDTVFWSQPLSYNGLRTTQEKVDFRKRWVADAQAHLSRCDLIFLDPDNGLAGEVARHKKQGPKWVFYDEIDGYLQRGQSVVIIQFMGRQKGGTLVFSDLVKRRLMERTAFKGDIQATNFSGGKSIIYYILPAQRHIDKISARLSSLELPSKNPVFSQSKLRSRKPLSS